MTATINASTSSGLIQTADTSGTLALQSNGTTQFTVSSTGAYGQLKSGTAVASTSGTSIDFTSIPSWVKRITVVFQGVSTNGSSNILIRLGSGSVTTSGYVSSVSYCGLSQGTATSTAGFVVAVTGAGQAWNGALTINLLNVSSYLYCEAGVVSDGTNYSGMSAGNLALGGALDRVRITTVNGTDTFDAGSINILYEG